MIKVIIADDEESGRKLIRQYLKNYQNFKIVAEANNGLEAVELINDKRPELIFLDVKMPVFSGLEVIKHLEEIPQIIFSTAFDKYAINAFEVHAIDYLLKPYTKARFDSAIAKISDVDAKDKIRPLADKIIFEQDQYPARILLQKGRRLFTVNTENIEFVEAFGDYSKVHTEQSTYISNRGISNLEEKLHPQTFMRVHRSHIININRVVNFTRQGKGFLALMRSNKTVKVSRGYAAEIKKIIL